MEDSPFIFKAAMIMVYGSSSRIQAYMVIGGLFLFSLLCFLVLLRVPRVDGQLIGSDGTYYYVISFNLVNGQTVLLKGDLTILR